MALHNNSRECSVGFQYPEDSVEDGDIPASASSGADCLEFGRRIVSYVRGQAHARLTVDCLYLALGDADVESETMTTTAAKHGITKAAVSKRVARIRRDLHLPITFNNKPAQSTKKYALANRSPLDLTRRIAASDSRPLHAPRASRS